MEKNRARKDAHRRAEVDPPTSPVDLARTRASVLGLTPQALRVVERLFVHEHGRRFARSEVFPTAGGAFPKSGRPREYSTTELVTISRVPKRTLEKVLADLVASKLLARKERRGKWPKYVLSRTAGRALLNSISRNEVWRGALQEYARTCRATAVYNVYGMPEALVLGDLMQGDDGRELVVALDCLSMILSDLYTRRFNEKARALAKAGDQEAWDRWKREFDAEAKGKTMPIFVLGPGLQEVVLRQPGTIEADLIRGAYMRELDKGMTDWEALARRRARAGDPIPPPPFRFRAIQSLPVGGRGAALLDKVTATTSIEDSEARSLQEKVGSWLQGMTGAFATGGTAPREPAAPLPEQEATSEPDAVAKWLQRRVAAKLKAEIGQDVGNTVALQEARDAFREKWGVSDETVERAALMLVQSGENIRFGKNEAGDIVIGRAPVPAPPGPPEPRPGEPPAKPLAKRPRSKGKGSRSK